MVYIAATLTSQWPYNLVNKGYNITNNLNYT